MKKYIDEILIVILMLFVFLMIKIILQYIPYSTDVAFLQIKQNYIAINIWRWAFFIHVYSSVFVLFAGFTQFNKRLKKQRPQLHRKLGYLYVLNILCITGPASFIMSFYANGGIFSRISFVTLSILWILFTYIALIKAKNKQFKAHHYFMIRSYALTLSAITLRAWKYGISNLVIMPPMDIYRIVAWLGWVVNIIIAEYYIRLYLMKTKK